MEKSKLLARCEKWVLRFLEDNLSTHLRFHNVEHTIDVVAATRKICEVMEMDFHSTEMITAAAWFHDCGYAKVYAGHEEVSMEIAREFLYQLHGDENTIAIIIDCIAATKFPQQPNGLRQAILCDADMFHFTRVGYPAYAAALRYEFEYYLGNRYTDSEWIIFNCVTLADHTYSTSFGRQVLSAFKEVNIRLYGCNSKQTQSD